MESPWDGEGSGFFKDGKARAQGAGFQVPVQGSTLLPEQGAPEIFGGGGFSGD
jgi:hypothetical protein